MSSRRVGAFARGYQDAWSAIAVCDPSSSQVGVQSPDVWLVLGSIEIHFQHDGSVIAIATATAGPFSQVVEIQSLGVWLRLALASIAIHFQHDVSAIAIAIATATATFGPWPQVVEIQSLGA